MRQLDEKRLHWVASFGGRTHKWDAETTEQRPDERIAWKDLDGKTNAGVVTFHRLGEGQTRVTLQMDWEPEGAVEKVGASLGFDERRIKADMQRFKEFIEGRGGQETGAWRGEVDQSSTS